MDSTTISQPSVRCPNCGTLEHHYRDEAGRLWLWCGKCRRRWRWHSDTPSHLFKPPVHADHIRQVVLAFPDATPEGWEDRAEPQPLPVPSVRDALIAPPAIDPAQIDVQKPWQGTIAKKPWQYRVTAVIPHRNTPEHLELCLQFLSQQTEPPYVMIVDTGSDDESLARVLALRSESVEVHQIACHAVEEYADTVCYAMDLAMSACRTEYLWSLHSDCFIINRNLLADLLSKADGGKQPVIGYESSSANRFDECRGMVSHTCTLLHMPAMRRLDVTWSRPGLAERARAAGQTVVFDPEMSLNYRLRERGLEPLILGPEAAHGIERDANRVHLRSGTLTEQVVARSENSRVAYEGVVAELKGMIETRRSTVAASRVTPGEITVFNLLYHIAPFTASDAWRWNVAELKRRLPLFNGKRIVAIVTGPEMRPPADVIRELDGNGIHFVIKENNRALGEAVTFGEMLSLVSSTVADEATFYAHAKGSSKAPTAPEFRAIHRWAKLMYHYCLDNREAVVEALTDHACAGTFKNECCPSHFPGNYSKWHFSGTFFWFRNADLFGQHDWASVDRHRHGVEAYLSKFFSAREAHCLFFERRDGDAETMDLYDDAYLQARVLPAHERRLSPKPSSAVASSEFQPRADLISPVRGKARSERPWEGSLLRKPWDFQISVAIPLMDTPDTIELVIELLRLQTMRPYIMLIDTGSKAEAWHRIESLRSEDVEVHAIRSHGVLHSSDYPAMAMDLAFTLCRSRYLFATHADCFLRKRTFLEELVAASHGGARPVIGYEMTPRSHPDWVGMVSHTATLYHMETMDKIGFGWSMRRLCNKFGVADKMRFSFEDGNWPDTELLGNYILRENGIQPLLIGKEENFKRTLDENMDHCRTLTSAMLYSPDHYAKAAQWAEDAKRDAARRINIWRRESEL